MAEVLLRHHGGRDFEVFSAGTNPRGINPLTERVLAEAGLPTAGLSSQSVRELVDQPFDYVVTVCDSARQTCPVFPGGGQRLHWGLEDPAEATGSDEQRLAVFRATRDEIERRVSHWLASVGQAVAVSQPPY